MASLTPTPLTDEEFESLPWVLSCQKDSYELTKSATVVKCYELQVWASLYDSAAGVNGEEEGGLTLKIMVKRKRRRRRRRKMAMTLVTMPRNNLLSQSLEYYSTILFSSQKVVVNLLTQGLSSTTIRLSKF